MKTYSSAIEAYRSAGKPHHQINFISFKVKDIDAPANLTWCHFCSADDTMTVTVTDPDTGAAASRTFLGGGHLVSMGDLTRSEGAVVRSQTLVLSGASSSVLDMVFGYDCREAGFQWFIGEVDQDTGLLVDAPVCEFVGQVNTIDLSDGALAVNGGSGAESQIPVTLDSLAAMLLARNYDMRSLDVSKGRSGDLFFEHAGNAHHWRVWWGKDKKSENDRKGGDKKVQKR